MNWYKISQSNKNALDPRWTAKKLDEGLYELRFENQPMLEFRLVGGYEGIKEIRTHGHNFMMFVPKDVRLPVINEIMRLAEEAKE